MFMYAKTIITALVFVLATSALAWTEAETNSVVHELIRLYGHRAAVERQNWLKAGNVIDCGLVDGVMEELPRFERIAWPTAEDLFGYEMSTNVPGWNEWSSSDRRNAFGKFISGLTNCNWAVVQQLEIEDAVNALELCRGLGCTNATPVAKEMTMSVDAPMSVRIAAAQLYFELSGNQLERDALTEAIVTNKHVQDTRLFREGVYALQCNALSEDYDENRTNGVHESARMLYSNLEFPSRAVDLDALLLKIYPTYSMSSNRLVVAQKGLSNNRPARSLVEYFSPITNQLLNAGQPLPVVDGL